MIKQKREYMIKLKYILLSILMIFIASCEKKPTSSESYKIIRKDAGYRFDKNWWIYVHVEGAPFERGKQFAFLVAPEYKRAIETINYIRIKCTKNVCYERNDKKS